MTRCTLLDEWFNHQSSRVDSVEKKTNIDFVTGLKIKSPKQKDVKNKN